MKPLTEFRLNRSRVGGVDGYCRPCRNEYANPKKRDYYRRRRAAEGRVVVPGDRTTEERFRDKVVVGANDQECWEWCGRKAVNGYAMFQVNRRTVLAHRYSYELHVGRIPTGMDLDHLCRNRGCVNPAHLEPVTTAENTRRGNLVNGRAGPAKTHCKNGHPWTPENIVDRGRWGRTCRQCLRAANRRTRKAVKRFKDRRDPAYCAWIRTLPCVAVVPDGLEIGLVDVYGGSFLVSQGCGWAGVTKLVAYPGLHCAGPIECAHVRTRGAGANDRGETVALCRRHHRQQHRIGIQTFQHLYNLDLPALAARLADRWEQERRSA